MTDPPPPTPETEMSTQEKKGVLLPVDKIMEFAKGYSKYHGLVKWGARMAGYKIPREIDELMDELNKEGANPETLQRLERVAGGRAEYGPQQEEWQPPGQEIVQPRIGERVLTRDLAYRAWLMNKKQGISLREIALHFTNEGYPCSHATVAEYVNQVDEEMDESSSLRRSAILKGALLIIVPAVAAFVLEHFLKW
jgi:hypothetical protein